MKDLIVKTARTWYGVPFVHQGRSRQGVDCVGLLICVCRELGIPFEDDQKFLGWSRRPPSGTIGIDLFKSRFNQIETYGAGDFVMMYMTERRRPQHLGILTNTSQGLGIIHTHTGVRGVMEMPLGIWEQRIIAAFSFTGE